MVLMSRHASLLALIRRLESYSARLSLWIIVRLCVCYSVVCVYNILEWVKVFGDVEAC